MMEIAQQNNVDTGPVGLGGWLILPIIGLFITPLFVGATVVNNVLPSFKPEVWSVLTTPGTEAYHPLWAPLIIFETIANVILIIGAIVLLVLLFQKKKIFPKLMIGLYLFNVLVVGVDFLALASFITETFPEIAKEVTADATRNLTSGVVAAAIWVPYFFVSERVKNTFVN